MPEKNAKKAGNSKGKKKPVDPENVTCFRCREKGHFASQCPTKRNGRGGRDNNDSQDYAFVASYKEKPGSSKVREKSVQPFREVIDQGMAVDKTDAWLTDSGASRQISHHREWFAEFTPSNGGVVVLGNDRECEVKGEGVIRIATFVDGRWNESRIEGVLYVPSIRKNLFSVGMCTKKGHELTFSKNRVKGTREERVVAIGVKQSNAIFRMIFKVLKPRERDEINVSSVDLKIWHKRLGHVGARALCDMVRGGLVDGVKLKNTEKFVCEPCELRKSHRQPFRERPGKRSSVYQESAYTRMCVVQSK